MSTRVAFKATLVVLVVLLTLLGGSVWMLCGTRNAELSQNLETTYTEWAEHIERSTEGGLDRAAVIGLVSENATTEGTVGYYAADGAAWYEDDLPRALSATEIATANEGGVKVIAGRDSEQRASHVVLYRFADGTYFRAAVPNVTFKHVLTDMLPSYLVVLVLACFTVFVTAYFVDRRRVKTLRGIQETLENFAEGTYDARVAEVAGEKRVVDSHNAVLNRIQENIFRQRSRDYALNVVVNQMQNGILVVDENLNLLLATPVARRLLGIAPKSEGKLISEASKDVRLDDLFNEAMRQEGVYTNEVAAKTALGRGHRPLRLYVSSMREGEKLVGALAMIEDITHVRRLEQVRTDFVANVSHELKTPLTSIKGFVETLMDGAISNPEMANKFLKIIMMEAERLTRLINDILSISKLESGMNEVAVERLRLDKMAYDVADMLRFHAGEKDVTINAHMNSTPVYIMANSDQVQQMLINLTENAIKYNRPGGSVTVHVFGNETAANLCISDTGIGIAEEHLPRLFERFYRVDKGRSRSMGGTGLGLAIVKHIVKGIGGEIEVHSKLGEGTEFLVTLPIALPPAESEMADEDYEFA